MQNLGWLFSQDKAHPFFLGKGNSASSYPSSKRIGSTWKYGISQKEMNHLHHQFSSAKLLLVSRSGFIPFSISAFQWNEKITTILGLGFLDGKKMHSPNYAVARDWEVVHQCFVFLDVFFRRKKLPSCVGTITARWWFQICFIFTSILGKISNLTNIFQVGWNHQLDSNHL